MAGTKKIDTLESGKWDDMLTLLSNTAALNSIHELVTQIESAQAKPINEVNLSLKKEQTVSVLNALKNFAIFFDFMIENKDELKLFMSFSQSVKELNTHLQGGHVGRPVEELLAELKQG